MLTTNQIRQKYLEYFKKHEHEILPSASLLPENDPTTLFTGSGMQPMLPYLLGQSHPKGKRLVDSQKCFRAVDIEEVGDNRHTTFFEMLGNWSLGDYFKQEQILWMWTFLTKEIGLNPQHLYITCFRGNEALGIPRDTEAAELWQGLFKEVNIDAKIGENPEQDGIQEGERIFYYPEKKNWWSRAGVPGNMPVGEPGGPDAEMFWDFGSERGLHEQSPWKEEPCHVNCDCGRFMEIGNNVFMMYQKTDAGFVELQQKNIDFGGGLERIAAALNNDPDMFMIDVFAEVKKTIEALSGKLYGQQPKETYAFRVILDHIRAATFLIADGAVPSNKDQGYFTRRLIRRAVRYGRDLGIHSNFCADIANSYIATYTEAYKDLADKQSIIIAELQKEEEKFRKTLDAGIKEFEKLLAGFAIAFEKTGRKITEISGKQAFQLYDTFGFPIEITQELAAEHGLTIDSAGFTQAFDQHKDMSREASVGKFKGGLADHSDMSLKYHTATHLLHIALRKVLGNHVEQKGSNITPERLRFDFNHAEKMTAEQIKQVEDLVNAAIQKDYPVSWQEMPVQQAFDQGVIGVFPDRYDDVIKVYTIGDPAHSGNANPTEPTFSREICGGPHVEHTGVLGVFKISKEESSSAGIRRIKAILQ